MTQSKVPLQTFDSILKEIYRSVSLNDYDEYRCAGVRLNGLGVFVRERRQGHEILKKHVQRQICEGDIIYSTLFSQKGAFAVVDKEHADCIVSEKFPTFTLTSPDIDRDYMKWFFRSGYLSRATSGQVTGMAAFSLSHLSKKKFLKLTIPVPKLELQRRIVRICEQAEAAASKIANETARAQEALSLFVQRTVDHYLSALPRTQLSDLGDLVIRPAEITASANYKQVTVAMNHRGCRLRRECDGAEIRSPGQSYVKPGDLLFSRIDLRNGAIGFISDELEDAVVTRDFPIFRFREESPLLQCSASAELRHSLS